VVLFFHAIVVDFEQAGIGMVSMKTLATMFCVSLLLLQLACTSEKPLEPTEGNALRELFIATLFGNRTIFTKYDYYMATNVSGGGTLEGLAMNSATLWFDQSHRVTVKAWYPGPGTLIASNTFSASSSVNVSFSGKPVYAYTNTLRIQAWDEDEGREVLNAEW